MRHLAEALWAQSGRGAQLFRATSQIITHHRKICVSTFRKHPKIAPRFIVVVLPKVCG